MADETKVEISIEANKATGAVSVATTEIYGKVRTEALVDAVRKVENR